MDSIHRSAIMDDTFNDWRHPRPVSTWAGVCALLNSAPWPIRVLAVGYHAWDVGVFKDVQYEIMTRGYPYRRAIYDPAYFLTVDNAIECGVWKPMPMYDQHGKALAPAHSLVRLSLVGLKIDDVPEWLMWWKSDT